MRASVRGACARAYHTRAHVHTRTTHAHTRTYAHTHTHRLKTRFMWSTTRSVERSAGVLSKPALRVCVRVRACVLSVGVCVCGGRVRVVVGLRA